MATGAPPDCGYADAMEWPGPWGPAGKTPLVRTNARPGNAKYL